MRVLVLWFIAAFAISCEPKGHGIPQKQEKITRNLPTQDREFLLKPLEASMEDIRHIIENDQSLFESSYDFDSNGVSGNVRFKLSGRDTLMIVATLIDGMKRETHQRFWDGRGELFILESETTWLSANHETQEKRAYKFYFEEGYSLISSYGKAAFDGADYSSSWSSIQLTAEEFRYILYRTRK